MKVFNQLRGALLLVTVLPLVVISIIFASYLYFVRASDAENYLLLQGDNSARYLAVNSELPVFSGNMLSLAELAAVTLNFSDVDYVAFYDAQRQLLLSQGVMEDASHPDFFKCDSDNPIKTDANYFFCRPILSSLVSVNDFSDSLTDEPNILGWVVVGHSTEQLILFKLQVLTRSLLIGLFVAFIASILAFQFSRRLTSPIKGMVALVKNTTDSLDEEIRPIDELVVLRRALVDMLRATKTNEVTLQDQISRSTEELRRLNNDLIVRNEMLLATQQKLELAAKSKDNFLAKISHELRTPLAAIKGYTELLEQAAHSDSELGYLDNINIASNSLLLIIDDILTLAKVKEGQMVLDAQVTESGDFLQRLTGQHALKFAQKNLEFVVDVSHDFPSRLVIDAPRVLQILNNLLSNAGKFTEQGSIVLTCSILHSEQHSAEIIFEIIDTGIGIEKYVIDALFEPFTQADETISRRFGGSGLGLAICKQLAQIMNGDVFIKSEPGQGTVATLKFKLDKKLYTLPTKMIQANQMVLVIADNARARVNYRKLFAQRFSEVFLVENIQKAKDVADKHQVSHVFYRFNSSAQCDAEYRDMIVSLQALSSAKLHIFYPVGLFSEHFIKEQQLHNPAVNFINIPILPHLLDQHLIGFTPKRYQENLVNSLAGLRLLLVEDQEIILKMLEAILQNLGIKVTSFNNAAQALTHLVDNKIDVILSDLHMPDINGADFFEKASSLLQDLMPPFFIITADTSVEESNDLINLGVQSVLKKPLEQAVLVSLLKPLVNSKTPQNKISPENKGILSNVVNQQEISKELHNLYNVISEHLVDSNWLAIREDIHQIKGLAGMAGLNKLLEMASNMSEHAKQKDVQGLMRWLERSREAI